MNREAALEKLQQATSLSNGLLISSDGKLGFTSDVIYENQETEDAQPTTIGKLFDENLELLAENEYKMPYENFSIVQRKLGDDGLIYMIGHETEIDVDKNTLLKRKKLVYGDLEVLVLDLEEGEVEVLKILTNSDKQIKNFTFRITDDSEIIVSGLIGDELSGVSGSFYVRYNSDLEEETLSFVDFEDDFITQDWSEKSKEKFEKKQKKKENKGQKKSDPSFYNYKIRDLIVKPNGTSTLLAEQYYVHVVRNTYRNANGTRTTTTTYYYYYKDIIALNFDKDGELLWKSSIDKYQSSINDGGYYSSFFTILEGNSINIIFNESESKSVNTDGMSLSEKKALRRNVIAVRVVLDEEGEQSKEKLIDFEENGLKLVPKVCNSKEENVAFIYARSTRGDKIGLIQW